MRPGLPSDDRVVVVGAGPAGWAAAAALADAGRPVTLVAPDPLAPWRATYGAFERDLAGLDLPPPRRRWAEATVVGTRPHEVGAYVQLDNEAVLRGFVHRVERAGVTVVAVKARAIEPGRVTLADGRRLTAGLVVDATGAPAGWRAAQRAVGIVARFDEPPGSPGGALLMDWSHWPDRDPTPTFLYAFDLGDGWWLAEETSLASAPPMATALLEARLFERLRARGTPPREIAEFERVHIPLDAPIRRDRPGLSHLGAAGGQVHPATGYSVAATLRKAAAIGAAPTGEEPVGATGRGTRQLLLTGLGVLLGLDQGGSRAFFDAFFDLDADTRHRFLAPTGSRDVLRSGVALFAGAPGGVRRQLVDPRALSWAGRRRPRPGIVRPGRSATRARTRA